MNLNKQINKIIKCSGSHKMFVDSKKFMIWKNMFACSKNVHDFEKMFGQ